MSVAPCRYQRIEDAARIGHLSQDHTDAVGSLVAAKNLAPLGLIVVILSAEIYARGLDVAVCDAERLYALDHRFHRCGIGLHRGNGGWGLSSYAGTHGGKVGLSLDGFSDGTTPPPDPVPEPGCRRPRRARLPRREGVGKNEGAMHWYRSPVLPHVCLRPLTRR